MIILCFLAAGLEKTPHVRSGPDSQFNSRIVYEYEPVVGSFVSCNLFCFTLNVICGYANYCFLLSKNKVEYDMRMDVWTVKLRCTSRYRYCLYM